MTGTSNEFSLHIDLVFTLISHMQELAENFEREKKSGYCFFFDLVVHSNK